MSEIAFISGHLDVTQAEFDHFYKQHIDTAIEKGHSFVVGDARGADTLAQVYLHSRGVKNVTVFHMFKKPRGEKGGVFPTKGGFRTDDERDSAMSSSSTYDIAWLRDPERNSGTRRNLERRTKQDKR